MWLNANFTCDINEYYFNSRTENLTVIPINFKKTTITYTLHKDDVHVCDYMFKGTWQTLV